MKQDDSPLRSGVEMRVLLLAAAVGVLGGLGAVGFRALVDVTQGAILGPGTMLEAARALPWWGRLLVPTIGAGVAAWLLFRIGRESQTTGVSDLMERVSLRTGTEARAGPTLLRAMASMGVLATGGSVGREGPILQISASLAAETGRRIGLTGQRLGLLLGCGVAAGMASAYNAPVAGALFALELILANFAIDVFVPVVIASVAATTVSRIFLGNAPVYDIPASVTVRSLPVEAGAFLALGILAGLASWAFLRALRLGEAFFQRLPISGIARMTLGGLGIGVIGLGLPEVWGNGFNVVDRLLHDEFGFGFVALLLVTKIVATAVSIGSGAPGGVFTPSLFVGACLGMLTGNAMHALLPAHAGPVQAYELVGMAGLLAATTQAPIMAVFILVEMTADFDMVVPLLLGAVAATMTARYLLPDSIYTGKIRRRGVRIPEGLEELALTATRVRDVMRQDQQTIPPGEPFDALLPALLTARRDALYVVGAEHRLLGAIHLREVKQLLGEREVGGLLVAADVAKRVPSVREDVSLAEALETLESPDLEEVPVVDGSGHLLGVVTRRDVLAALSVEVLKTRSLRAKFVSPGSGTSYVELPPGHRLARVPVNEDMVSRTIEDIDFRRATGLSILTVVRSDGQGVRRLLPEPQLVLTEDDSLVVYGASNRIDEYVRSCT